MEKKEKKGKGNEEMLGCKRKKIENCIEIVRRRSDVEKEKLVGEWRIIGEGGLKRIKGIDKIKEVKKFEEEEIFKIEKGNKYWFKSNEEEINNDND